MMPFGVKQVADLLGTTQIRLNKLGVIADIKPSIDKGGTQGKPRHFSVQDVCDLGLALWLWRAGLRGSAISDVIGHKASQGLMFGMTSLARIKKEAGKQRLLVAVNFRRSAKKEHGKTARHYQNVWITGTLEHAQSHLRKFSGVVVPVGKLLHVLARALET